MIFAFPGFLVSKPGWALAAALLALVSPGRGETLVAATGAAAGVARDPEGLFRAGNWETGGYRSPKGAMVGGDWRAFAGGEDHFLLVDGQGRLFAWGSHIEGELGIGEEYPPEGNLLARVGADSDWQTVSAGRRMSAGIKTDGSLWAWGAFPGTQGGPINSNVPLRVGLANDWKSVSSGFFHRLALKTDGSLWAWGYNNHYSFGNGTRDDSSIPVRIGTDTDWASIACVGYASLAIKTDGSLWGWGIIGAVAAPPAPTQPGRIGTANDWKEIASNPGGGHFLAIKTDGTLWSWGNNAYGQLGQGDTLNRDAPSQVGSSATWARVAAAGTHVVAVKTDGTIWHWGGGSFSWSSDIPSSTVPVDRTNLYAPVPEIKLQKALTPGESIFDTWLSPYRHWTFPIAILGEPDPQTLTIHNDGLMPLEVSGIELPDGFSCSAVPGPIEPFNKVEVALTPSDPSAGEFSGSVKVLSNDPLSPVFEFYVQATVVSPVLDSDGDGMNDGAEVKLSSLGFHWESAQPVLVADFFTKAKLAGFVTPQDVKEVRLQSPVLQREAGGGPMSLELEFRNALDHSLLLLDEESFQQQVEGQGLLHLPVPAQQGYLRVRTR